MDFSKLASDETITKTVASLEKRNVTTFVVNDRVAALAKLKELLPDGAELSTASSTTLEEIGFIDILTSKQHPWKNLKDAIVAETDKAKQDDLRRRSVLADYFLGSVHAVTEAGEILDASASGSQTPGYAFTSPHVIWVVGTQKIVADFNTARQRIGEYVVPLEDARMKKLGYPGTRLMKLLTIFGDFNPQRYTMILVKEKLGF
jgi:hypothetical protein